jgi:hypothetical protein
LFLLFFILIFFPSRDRRDNRDPRDDRGRRDRDNRNRDTKGDSLNLPIDTVIETPKKKTPEEIAR